MSNCAPLFAPTGKRRADEEHWLPELHGARVGSQRLAEAREGVVLLPPLVHLAEPAAVGVYINGMRTVLFKVQKRYEKRPHHPLKWTFFIAKYFSKIGGKVQVWEKLQNSVAYCIFWYLK